MDDLKILVVDDSPTMRKIIIGQLNQAGYFDTGEAEDGLQGIEELENGDYNFVLTDWNMPKMDGLTFIQTLRGRPEFVGLPILVVTTRNTQGDVVTAIKAGANNYVVKPFGPTQLSEKIEKVLQALI
ncbi:MAG: response regulator [Candidatus Latescibacteria bacterium]|jgi:two-component system chemotaxis response regulator CheY|nr:response regulator [Candidatus Latescibacterota bacterium]